MSSPAAGSWHRIARRWGGWLLVLALGLGGALLGPSLVGRAALWLMLLPGTWCALRGGFRAAALACALTIPLSLLAAWRVLGVHALTPADLGLVAGAMVLVVALGYLRDLSRQIESERSRRERAHRLLRQSQGQHQALLSAIEDMILCVDRAGRASSAGLGAVRGVATPAPFYVEQLLPPHAVRLIREHLERAWGNDEPIRFAYSTRDGPEVRDYEGWLCGAPGNQTLVCVRDVSPLKRLERELAATKEAAREAARVKTQFLANMSHEIRTPMNGVIGMTNLLLETSLSAEQREYAQIIHKSGQALLEVIDDILDFAKIEAGKLQLEAVEFELWTTVDECLRAVASQARAKGLDLGGVFEAGVPRRVVGDPTRLRQVLANLLSNGVKFTDRGHVLVRVSPLAEDPEGNLLLRFVVQDTGCGVSPEIRPRLFRPILMGEDAQGRSREGTGLGLAIAHELVRLMGGEIACESSVGEGASFQFTARVEAAAVEPAGAPAFAASLAPVLVVQEALGKTLLCEQLQALGVRWETASPETVAAVLEQAQARSLRYLAVVVDSEREPARWAGALERLVDWTAAHTLPLVLIAPAERVSISEGLRSGAVRILTWPVGQADLGACLAALAGRITSPATGATLHPLGSAQPCVLVADDDPVNQRVAVRAVQQAGCCCDVVSDGEQAAEAAASGKYDLVLMDCQMPGMDGFEATRRIRQRERADRRIAIVALTAATSEHEHRRAREAGMDGVMVKPIDFEELRGWIARTAREPSAGAALPPLQEGSALAPEGSALSELAKHDVAFLREGGGRFLQQAPRQLQVMRAALDVGDVDAVAKAARAMRYASVRLGARRLADRCGKLESTARSGDTLRLSGELEVLAAELDIVRRTLLRLVAQP